MYVYICVCMCISMCVFVLERDHFYLFIDEGNLLLTYFWVILNKTTVSIDVQLSPL